MPAQPTTDTTQNEWSLDQLVAMLRDENAPSPKLILKQGRIEVQRVLFKNKPSIEKRYLGNLSDRQQYEIQQLQKIGGLNDVLDHVASLSSSENMSTYQGRENVARTRWYGLDTQSWQRLAEGDNSPFKRNVPTLLAWVSGVLQACKVFHKLGFVLCDLLPQNIVIRHRVDDADAGRYTLLMDKPFIFDLEFCLSPQKGGRWGTGQVRDGWVKNDGSPLLLTPAYHSEFICAGEVAKVIDKDDDFILKREYKKNSAGYVVLKKDPFKDLPRVDWGVDLFSLGVALQLMLDEADFRGQHSQSDDAAYQYLENLPRLLRSFNQLAPDMQPRDNRPHDQICEEIDARIGTSRWNECTVNLPERFAKINRPANPMLDSLDDSPFPPVKFGSEKKPLPAWHPATVTIDSMNLAVGIDPVTEQAFLFGKNSSKDVLPKVNVTRAEIEKYLNELNRRLGLPIASIAQTSDISFRQRYTGFRLLSFEEWMDVCRAGFDAPYAYAIGQGAFLEGELRPEHAVYDWSAGLSLAQCRLPSQNPIGPQPISHPSNRFNRRGVRAMHGNVWELVLGSGRGGLRACGGAADSLPQQLAWDGWTERAFSEEKRGNTGFRVCRTSTDTH